MPRRHPGRVELTLAALGYLVTFLMCLAGAAVTAAAMAAIIVADLLYGLWTGTFRQRLRKQRW